MNARDDEPADYSSGHPFRRRSEDADAPAGGGEAPVDLAAVVADDARLDMLGAESWSVSDGELARVLVAWRREVDAEPIGELVDTGTATAAITTARPRAAHHAPRRAAAAPDHPTPRREDLKP